MDVPTEIAHNVGDEVPALIASIPAGAQHRRIAFGVVIVLSVAFAASMPFATIQATRIDAFLTVSQAIVLFAEILTAIFLFSQFSIQPRPALLALASGYICSGLFAFLQTLDFPGAYSATGIITGTPSGAVWFLFFWRITFPLAVIAYVSLKDTKKTANPVAKIEPGRAIGIAIACAFATTAGLTWLLAAGYLPSLNVGATQQPLVQYFAVVTWSLNAIAVVLLFIRKRTILDVWLIVAVFVSLPDLTLAIFYAVTIRFSVGWYIGKAFLLIGSCTVLVVLLWETMMLYARLASAFILQRVIVEAAPNGVLMVDDQGTIKEVNTSIETLFGYKRLNLLGQSIEVLVPYRQIDSHLKLRNSFLQRPEARAMGAGRDLKGRRKDGSEFPVEIGLSPIERNGTHGVLATVIDISERKRAEEHQHALMAELDHRVKNVLARVAAVVMFTRKGSYSMDEFVRTLDGRIQSMATAHSLLSQSRWQGVGLADLVRSQLAPYATDANMTISGTDIMLTAAATQVVAMVLHELVTNAAKYGALSTPGGRVSVSWDRRPNGDAAANLMIVWRELGSPPIAAEFQSGYGTSLIRELIPHELGGTVDLVLASDGARCSIEFPLGRG